MKQTAITFLGLIFFFSLSGWLCLLTTTLKSLWGIVLRQALVWNVGELFSVLL